MGSHRPRFIAMRQQRDNLGFKQSLCAKGQGEFKAPITLLAVCSDLSLFSLHFYLRLYGYLD